MAPVGLFDFSGAFESFERYFFFFDYPRVDTFSFTKIGKPVSTGWILGFTICQGFACVRQMDVQGYELYFK